MRKIPHDEKFTTSHPSFYSMHSIRAILRMSLLSIALVYGADRDPKDLEVHFMPPHHVDLTKRIDHKGSHPSGHGAMPFSHFMKMFPMDTLFVPI